MMIDDDSESACTYDEYAAEMVGIGDLSYWKPMLLSEPRSEELLGFKGGVCGLSDCHDGPVCVSIHIVNHMLIDEYTFEPLIPVPLDCWSTLSSLINPASNAIVLCLSNSESKNIIFGFDGCMLACGSKGATMYIPSIVKKSAYRHVEQRGIYCSSDSVHSRESHHRLDVPEKLYSKSKSILANSRSFNVSRNHLPVHSDGYTKACSAIAIICMTAQPCEKTSDVDSNEPEEMSERNIVIQLLDIMPYSLVVVQKQQKLPSTQ